MIIGVLGFDIDRLTISASAACSSRECDSPSSLACFPSELVLMPAFGGNPEGFGRVRTELLASPD
jgi:hypothetical protein